ncbi:solute carrier family 23 protein [Kribbella sp. NPDC054772]
MAEDLASTTPAAARPEEVTGTIITVIGVSLLPVSFDWALGGVGSKTYGDPSNIALAVITLLIVLVISRVFQGFVSRLSILIGMVAGTLIAIPWGKADFSAVGHGEVVSFPPVFGLGMPVFDAGAIVAMTVVVLVIMTETMADIIAIGQIVETPVDHKRVANGLRADMVSSTVAPVFGAFPASAFAQNVGLVAITGITSRFTVAVGGGVLVMLGLVPLFGRVVAAIPAPVLGGAVVVLFGSVAASGIRTLSRVEYGDNLNLVVVAVSLAMGLVSIVRPHFWDEFPSGVGVVLDSGISAAAVTAVLLNLFFNQWRALVRSKPSVFAAAPDERGTALPGTEA